LITTTLFPACRSHRNIVKDPIKDGTALVENRFQFETLSMKATIAASSNTSQESYNLTGTIRMISDSVIWISVSPGLGIEAVRLYITQDSVFFMNRINNEYAASTFGFFNTQYQVDLDFNMLQSLLTGNSSVVKTLENQQRKLQVNYSNFGKIEGQLFPHRLSFELLMQESGKTNKTNVNINFSKIELNKEVSVPFTIPEKYKRIEL
jgi:hypothetical protein